MRIIFPARNSRAGMALLLVIVVTSLILAGLGVALLRSTQTVTLNERHNQYTRSVAAAEAATEKVLSQLSKDYLNRGDSAVVRNLQAYRMALPQEKEMGWWSDWEFSDAQGQVNQASVETGKASSFVRLNSIYRGLNAYSIPIAVTVEARQKNSSLYVVGAVRQEVELTRIPIFQFAMYSSLDMEISCGQPFTVTGRVHSNKNLYVEPDNVLTFLMDVTSAGDIVFGRHPLDGRGAPKGSVTYKAQKDAKVAALTLPIGTDNTPEAVREIIHLPPAGEDPESAMGRQRYFNQSELIVVVSNDLVQVTTGRENGFAVIVPTNQAAQFVTVSRSFWDQREEKTVRPVDLDVNALRLWSATNSNVRPALGFHDVSSVYVVDLRSLPASDLAAVRVSNGQTLPPGGLTVATGRPLYVLGHYNQPNPAALASGDTRDTSPASLVDDAVTILSPNWSDANSTSPVSARKALPTTLNAAILGGQVTTAGTGSYSGGMENFPRFLEVWGLDNPLTYNGSMVLMFPSLFATNRWGKAEVYSPPKRDWAFDNNFTNALLLPPLTPGLTTVMRTKWTTVAPNQTVIAAGGK